MSTRDAGGRWLRPGAAAAIVAAGVLIPMGYAAAQDRVNQVPLGYLGGAFLLMLVVICAMIAGALGAALVRGWGGTGPLLAGLLVACLGFEVVSVVALGEPVDDVAVFVRTFVVLAVPLLVGYGIGRGLARLD